MHAPRVLAAFALTLAAAACMLPFVVSLNPLSAEGDNTFEPALLGTWVQQGGDTWSFRRAGERAYMLIVREKELPAEFDVHLVRLGDFLFLDIFPGDAGIRNLFYAFHLVPVHSVSRIWLKGDVLLIAPLAEDWLREMLNQRRVDVANVRVHEHILLTASTDDLRTLVARYADDADAFPITIGLYRQKQGGSR